MKKKILLLMGIFSIGFILHAQVGINTFRPLQGNVFHIDGAGDNTSSTFVTPAEAENDIIIDSRGYMGVGTVTPKAKLDIVTTNRATAPAMRIVDGTQGLNKVLTSDAFGNASWVGLPNTDGNIHRITGQHTFSYGILQLLFEVQVPATANYLITIRWWGTVGINPSNGGTYASFNGMTSTIPENNPSADQFHFQDAIAQYVYPGDGDFISFSSSLYMSAQANEYIKIYVYVMDGGPWKTGTVLGGLKPNAYFPSVIIYRI